MVKLISYVATFIGLPDRQYLDIEVKAPNNDEAMKKAREQLKERYGRGDFNLVQLNELPE